MHKAAALFLCLLALAPAAAAGNSADNPFNLSGPLTQGALLRGQSAPGARVFLDGVPIKVSRSGAFIFGLAENSPSARTLRAELADGTSREQILKVSARQYETQAIEGLPPRQVSPGKEDLERIAREKERVNAARLAEHGVDLFDGAFARPASGAISGVYGLRRLLNGEARSPHLGLDIAAPKGDPVTAPMGGVVALAEDDMFFTGKTVLLDHGFALVSVFAHLDSIGVKPGDRVEQGAPIGTVGQSGRATGPHLHWGVHWQGLALDPALLLAPAP